MRCLGSIVLALALATTGCVKASTHQRAVDTLTAKLTAAQSTIDQRDARIRELEGNEARLHGEQDASAAELAELREKRAADEKRLAAFQDLQKRFQSMVDTGELEVTFRKGQMTLKLPSGVLFPSAGADLGDAGKKTLTKVTALLMPLKDRRFLIAGHTDNVPIKNEQFANNWYLSTARAITVVQFMIDQGFPAKQLAAAGYADKDPIASNGGRNGRKRNRRIEIIVVPDLSDLPTLATPK
ncbi:MAG: OmpA family protein [Deltaproteobacteria bacterium]|nr:OmpA family protein [Deltaproteobacteria bacterium]